MTFVDKRQSLYNWVTVWQLTVKGTSVTLISNGRAYVTLIRNGNIKGRFPVNERIKGNSYTAVKTQLTISPHSNLDAFLESAMLTLCSVLTVDATVSRGFTGIRQLVADRTVEETLTPFTCKNTIVTTRGRRVTHGTIDRLFWVIVPIDLMKL